MFLYPIADNKVCPKDFHCSNCGKVVKQKQTFIKTNHGRYCSECKAIAQEENRHKEKVLAE